MGFTDLTDVVLQHNPFMALASIGASHDCIESRKMIGCSVLPPMVSSEFAATLHDTWKHAPVQSHIEPGVPILSPPQYYRLLWLECYHFESASRAEKQARARMVFSDRVYNVGL